MRERWLVTGAAGFIYASSRSVYGDGPHLPKGEDRPGRPLSPCALSKWMNEETAELYARVFGPRQAPEGACAAASPRNCAALSPAVAYSLIFTVYFLTKS